MPITIKEVKTKKELIQFIRFANDLYKDCEFYTPSLELDELNMFNTKTNPTLDHSIFVNYLAYRDNKIVGRITGIINKIANTHWNVKKTRFGWFDFIDDYEVFKALLDAVTKWGQTHGMNLINGPVGFTDMDHQGLLLNGYEFYSPMISLYNFPYYEKHYIRYGLEKEADWIEYRVSIPDSIPEKMERIAKIVLNKYNLRIDKVKNKKEAVRKYGYTYFDVIDKAYQPLYNFQPLTQKQKKYYCDTMFPFINFDFITLVIDSNDEIIGVGVGMPDISKALKRCNGKLFPFGWYHILKALKAKKMDVFNLLLIAVRPDYQNKGINSLFFYDQIPYFKKYGIKYAETTAILEENNKNRSNWEYFDSEMHKRRRAYIKNI